MEKEKNLRLLGLSRKEEKVLLGLQSALSTPLALSRKTNISRPAIYAILQNLKNRGLVISHITNGKKHWGLAGEKEIEEVLYATKRQILKIPGGRKEVHGRSDSAVVVHRGNETLKKLVGDMLGDHKNERLYGFQGGVSAINWNKVFTAAETNKFNRNVKKNAIITEGILPDGWFEEQTQELGIGWAKDFEGRTTRINIIDRKYFDHGGQMWVFKKSLYLMSFSEEIIIEVRNSEIQKMILAIFEFMQDNSRAIDANALLRKLIEQRKKNDETNKTAP